MVKFFIVKVFYKTLITEEKQSGRNKVVNNEKPCISSI